jgi:hypothetical protein
MFSNRFLRAAAMALWAYGVVGIFVAAAVLMVGLATFEQVMSLQKAVETQRTALVQSVRGMSSTLRDTAAATSDFQRSIDTARGSADQASQLANDSAGTFRNMGESLAGLTILGLQPLVSIQPEFDRSADQLQQLAISLGSTREALAQNGSDIGRVGGDLSRLQLQVDTLASALSQPNILGLDTRSLAPLKFAFFGMLALVLAQSVFSIIAGVVVFRLQRLRAIEPRTATTNGVHAADHVRAS